MKRALYDNVKLLPYSSGGVIDRHSFISAILAAEVTAITGTPTAAKLTVAVTHSDTSDGTYTAVSDERLLLTAGGELPIDVEDGIEANIPIDLLGCKRYIKITATVSFTGGTTPSSTNAYAVALGDSSLAPVGN